MRVCVQTIVDGTPTVVYFNLRQEHVPYVSDYVAGTDGLMTIPDNVNDFHTHFGVSRQLLDVNLEEV